ncbi:MAG: antitoxin Xre/MbcA/ParS toxin-binding domain-containing protein [Kiloniellales bacterium]
MTIRRKSAHLADIDVLKFQQSDLLSDRLALIESIRSGLPFQMVAKAIKPLDMTIKDLAAFGVIPMRTLTHCKKSGKFTHMQSDRVARFLRVWLKACDTFGSPAKARKWMERPTRPLEAKPPSALLDTEEGARLVEDLLFRIDHGLSA